MKADRYSLLHPRALEGLRLFNRGLFFEAHEELEAAWMAENGPLRDLYRGILQVAVAYHHLERGNRIGARKMFKRSKRWLEPFQGLWVGIDVDRFKADAASIEFLCDQASLEGGFHPPDTWPPQIEFK